MAYASFKSHFIRVMNRSDTLVGPVSCAALMGKGRMKITEAVQMFYLLMGNRGLSMRE